LGLVAGSVNERRHFRSLREREARFRNQLTLASKVLPSLDAGSSSSEIVETRMVVGSVVVSVDHFKRFLAGFRLLFGGELGSYQTLIERGRREALLRMKESFPTANCYINVRLETSTISSGGSGALGCVEVLAYATGVRLGRRA
jgi:uncharacterized protein YbjQ (UPF0145 family)